MRKAWTFHYDHKGKEALVTGSEVHITQQLKEFKELQLSSLDGNDKVGLAVLVTSDGGIRKRAKFKSTSGKSKSSTKSKGDK